jgi:hypothetical protein
MEDALQKSIVRQVQHVAPLVLPVKTSLQSQEFAIPTMEWGMVGIVRRIV